MTHVQRYAAFTTDPAGGNPAGVVLAADGMDDDEMLRIAAEVGYSETAFVTRAGHEPPSFGLRYFSQVAEVPFCGHATIATGVALADAGIEGPFRFHTPAGVIEVGTERVDGVVRASLVSVPGQSRPVAAEVLVETLTALRWAADDLDPTYEPRVAYAGNYHLVLAAGSRARLADLDYDFAALKTISDREGWITLQLFWPESASRYHSRNPFPSGGVVEDPATGAGAAALGTYLRETGRITTPTTFTIVQGEDMGRRSELAVLVDPADTRVVVSGSGVRI